VGCLGWQVRVPIGRSVLELPAGMLDGDGSDFVGTAAREVHHWVTLRSTQCLPYQHEVFSV